MTNNKLTYCNPLPLPDMDQGYHEYKNPDYKNYYRCASDCTVIYDEGVWYVYGTSGSVVFYSNDGLNWQSKKLKNILLAAPAATKFRGKYYLMVNGYDLNLFVADTPFGEFKPIGRVHTAKGENVYTIDAALFSDNDEAMYIYWGCGQETIFGAKLSNDDPTLVDGEIKELIKFNPEHKWECWGAYNQCTYRGWIEGAHMYYKNGKYYLIYSVAGTEFPSYAMGVYIADSPLGNFKYQDTNPFIRGEQGVVKGCGHGSVVDGPNDTIWVFYTSIISAMHRFERRIGMDRVFIDEKGNLVCSSPTGIPQFGPNVANKDLIDCQLYPLTAYEFPVVSSCKENILPIFATDENPRSWWQPAVDDKTPSISIPLSFPFEVSAARIVWREVNLDYKNGIVPKPISYVIEGKNLANETFILFDNSNNKDDLCIDYREFEPRECVEVTLRFKKPEKYDLGVIDFTAFGKAFDINPETIEGNNKATEIAPVPRYYNF